MMPLDSYRLYQVERPKRALELRRADEQAAGFAAAVSWPFLAIVRAVRRPYPSAVDGAVRPLAEPAAYRGAMAG